MLIGANDLIRPYWPGTDYRVHLMVSGGADSMALMAVIAEFSAIDSRIIVVHHCHHGIDVNSDIWLQFVESESKRYGFLFQSHYLVLDMTSGFEARAREARYEAVLQFVSTGDVVMTAHHRDDQIETLLIRLSQGSGLIGWAGIPAKRRFGSGVLVRPFLSMSSTKLKSMLASQNLKHIVDPSNRDTRFLRNFIRLKFLPLLCRALPAAKQELLMLSQLATDQVCRLEEALGKGLPATGIDSVELARTEKLIQWQVRFFAQVNGRFAPSSMQIAEFGRQCIEASGDKLPEVGIGNGSIKIRRWNKKLYWVDNELLGTESDEPIKKFKKIEQNQSVDLTFPNGVLYLETGGIAQTIQVYWGPQVCSFRLGHKRPMQSLKQLAQTLGIVPWHRRWTPLLAIHDEIIGWGDIDCRESGLIAHSFRWKWRFVPRNKSDSSVS